MNVDESLVLRAAHISEAGANVSMSRLLVEHGLTWRWTPSRVRRSIKDKETMVLVARIDGLIVGLCDHEISRHRITPVPAGRRTQDATHGDRRHASRMARDIVSYGRYAPHSSRSPGRQSTGEKVLWACRISLCRASHRLLRQARDRGHHGQDPGRMCAGVTGSQQFTRSARIPNRV